ncbi:peptidylprolyl isomerase PrsA [Bacillus sp. WMMC1349]|uniref:peptidylprolyl isomerase n=1 Tax=Bacillus sp. WMMC1349 TaxID=2736254 RepID=UPI001553E672|nr:peptidylprolyl isomerase [Bacillus sp. WMMC1349]NPC92074.1 peptidylprolyl isomerase PrsA [Bacillus sp. WMMC1349]
MKKMVIAAVAATSILTLSACKGGDSEVVAETKAGDITKGELYDTLLEQNGVSGLDVLLEKKVLEDKYKVSNKEIDKRLDEYKKIAGQQIDAMIDQKGEDFVKKQIKTELLRKKAAEDNIKVTDKDVKQFYDSIKGKYHISHIIVKEKKTIEEVAKKLKKGEKFEDLAEEYSIDSSSIIGGDLSWHGKKEPEMDKTFLKAAFALKVGEISKPVKTKHGYHIIKIIEKRGKYEDMKKDLKKQLKELKINNPNEIQNAVDMLIKKADLNVKDKTLKKQVEEREKMPQMNGQG